MNIKYPEQKITQYNHDKLDISRIPAVVDVADIDQLPNDEYALLRKNGLGGSDSSSVLGVNPYKTLTELINEKCRTYLTDDEKAVGQETAVRKGRDLEPLIIKKASEAFGVRVIKPSDMYRHKDYPYLKMNFDGVLDLPEQYIACEIKVVTSRGEKHYAPIKAIYNEQVGWINQDVPHYEDSNNSVQTKAAQYGIPPYYYTQLQQEIMFTGDAPYGYLATLFEKTWNVYIFKVWRDQKCINDIIIQGGLTWDKIERKRKGNG